MIRCIFCGYCEEACPVDAIRLGPEYELADSERADFVYTKQMLLDLRSLPLDGSTTRMSIKRIPS